MNYTENYHLPPWEEDDRVMRSDFNNAMSRIDEGLAAGFTAERMPYVIGRYTGNGETAKVTLGFRPSFLIVTAQEPTPQDYHMTGLAVLGAKNFRSMITLESDGFSVIHFEYETFSKPAYPKLNLAGKDYSYIAFR